MSKKIAMWSSLAAVVLFNHSVLADTLEIKAAGTKWDPVVTFAKPGDTLKFSVMAGHDTVTIDGMVPEGSTGWKSQMGEELSVTLDKEGVYIFKCSPHVSLGMVGAVVVGLPANLEQVKASPENKGMVGRAVKQAEEAIAAKQ